MAVAQIHFDNGTYQCGQQYCIEGLGDKVFTITDIGTFPNKYQFDIYVGEYKHDDFYRDYPGTGSFYRVAQAQG